MTEPTLPSNFMETPEFKAAVAKEVAAGIDAVSDKIMERLSAARVQEGTTNAPDLNRDRAFAESLAMSIASLSDQGIGQRKKVAPDVLAERSHWRQVMIERVIAAAALTGSARPLYQLRHKVYLGEILVDPIYLDTAKRQCATEVYWPQVPNEAMIPINDSAKGIHEAFTKSIGGSPPPMAAPMKVSAGGLVFHQGRPPALNAMAEQLGTGEALDTGGLEIPHRGAGGQFKPVNVLGTVAKPAQQTV